MPQTTLTHKGQSTVPRELRAALKKPRERLDWIVQNDDSAVVRPQPNELEFFE